MEQAWNGFFIHSLTHSVIHYWAFPMCQAQLDADLLELSV